MMVQIEMVELGNNLAIQMFLRVFSYGRMFI